MDQSTQSTTWSIGAVELCRVPYFDTPLPADSIGLDGVAERVEWSAPWILDDQPAVGQAFWVVRADGQTIVVDPCGASDFFLRSGPEAVDHQEAAFALLRDAGCDPADVDQLVMTHLDGIGMAALSDGAGAWRAAFANAALTVSRREYDYILASLDPANQGAVPGAEAFAVLDEAAAVRVVDPPHELATEVWLRHTGGHGPGHCRIDIASQGRQAVMLGHLAISPLHAAVGVSEGNHVDADAAWAELRALLEDAHATDSLVTGSLWPAPGAARVTSVEPFVLVPDAG